MPPDHQCLFWAADPQHGYFTSAQAHACGFSNALVRHHAETGRYVRVRRGIYRLRDYPPYYREYVVIAWLGLGKERAVISHESALEFHELSDVWPTSMHFTIPRTTTNWYPKVPGTRVHLTTKPWKPGEVRMHDGMPITSPERSIVDSAEWGTGPEQIEMAVEQALQRGITTPERLRAAAADQSERVRSLIEQSIRFARKLRVA